MTYDDPITLSLASVFSLMVPRSLKSTSMPLSIFRYAVFNVDALCQLASSLRFGRCCCCDVTQVPVGGSLYWAVFVYFDDGVEWVFRSPRYDGAIRSLATIQKLVASEAATLKYINSYSAIPVPEVYAYRYDQSWSFPSIPLIAKKLLERQ